MKKTITLLAVAFLSLTAFSQSVIYSENFGTVTENTAVIDHTFQNEDITYYSVNNPEHSNLANIRTTNPSTGYDGASGNAAVFIPGNENYVASFFIDGINTSGYTNISLSLGHHKSTNASSNELTISVSEDGTSWTDLTYSRTTGAGTSNWILINPTGTIPATNSLKIRFTNNSVGLAGFRVDDVKLTGTASASIDNAQKSEIKLFPNPVTNGIVSVVANDDSDVKVEIFDVLGKKVLDAKTYNNTINVSHLNSGVYLVKLTTTEKSTTQKLVIK